jgi:hypothetical protein
MSNGVMVRTADPERIAAIARSLGVAVEPPSRLNPRGWAGYVFFDLLIVRDDAAVRPVFRICRGDPQKAAAGVARVAGDPPVRARKSDRTAPVVVGGVRLTFADADTDVATAPFEDALLLPYVDYVFAAAEAIVAAVAAAGGAVPRLAGPVVCARRWGRGVFALVVDASAGTDLGPVQAVLDDVGAGSLPTVARLSSDLDPATLAAVDRLAWHL